MTGSPAAQAWVAGVTQLGGDAAAAETTAGELDQRYSEPHRRYHDGVHVAAVVGDSAWLAHELRLGPDESAVVTLAACAHDVVYDARPGADEQASAQWARQSLAACALPSMLVERVAALVLATAGHTTSHGDRLADALLDADLAILGAPSPTYARYVADVRAEYAALPEAQWRTGRAAVLRAFLAREPIYRSDPARARWETAARINMLTELTSLEEPQLD